MKKNKIKLKVDRGILIGVCIGILMSLSFFSFSSNFLFALGAIIFWISFFTRPMLEYFNVEGILNVAIINTLITAIIFGFIGYLLNLLRKNNKSLFKSIIIILIISYIILFSSCQVMLTGDW